MQDADIHERDRDGTRDLVDAARTGDRQAFAQLFTIHYSRIHNFALARVGSPADAEEIADDVFVAAWKRLPSFEWTGAPFASWLVGIAHREVLMHLRTRSRRPKGVDLTQADEPSASDDRIDSHADRQQLVAALNELPDAQRQVLALRFYGGLSADEVAELLGLTAGNVRQIQLRALRRLRSAGVGAEVQS